MSNDNYSVAAGLFSTTNFFQAADAAAFGAVSATGQFAAFALFYIDGGIQEPGAAYSAEQFIWGNLDAAIPTTGWAIELTAVTSNPAITARCVCASGERTASRAIAAEAVVFPGYVDKLILAQLLYDGTNLHLGINGNIVATDTNVGADAPVASAVGASLGSGTYANSGATNVRILGAGYNNRFLTPFTNATVGAFASAQFRAAREAYATSFFINESIGQDWTHRYDLRQAAYNRLGTISKNAGGASSNVPPTAPSTLEDIGNVGFLPAAGITPAPLSRVGAGLLALLGNKNMDWYAGQGFTFTVPE